MGYFESARRKLKTPEAGNPPLVTGDLKKFAEELDAGGPLLVTVQSSAYTAKAGDMVRATNGAGISMPLASQSANREVGVFCVGPGNSSVSRNPFGPPEETIVGDLFEGTLTEGQHIRLASDGVVWRIVAGEGRRAGFTEPKTVDTGIVQGTNGAEHEVSASRDAEVLITCTIVSGATVTLLVGNPIAARQQATSVAPVSSRVAFRARVPAGQKWAIGATFRETSKVEESHTTI